ncbi:MAG: hypothetical protein NTY01_13345, partial [Verrucomicrobia bacterium]|nr:hypothetical protein [Verrucomicrobiota bacterium]
MKSVLKSWITVHRQLARAWHGEDVPWRFNERAHLGLFAAAVWQAGYVSLEEFASSKIDRDTENLQSRYSGRIDLYFNIR